MGQSEFLPEDLQPVARSFVDDAIFRHRARLNPLAEVAKRIHGRPLTLRELISLHGAAQRWAQFTDAQILEAATALRQNPYTFW